MYCGSSDRVDPAFRDSARRLGQLLGERGLGVVYGGGRVGLMGEVAEGALAAGGAVYGVITEKLQAWEVGHLGLTELFVVDSMHARKSMMAQLADAYIALPGGVGTWEELFEVFTLAVLGDHEKPLALLDFHGYYAQLLAFIEHAVATGFLRSAHADLLHVAQTAEGLVEHLESLA